MLGKASIQAPFEHIRLCLALNLASMKSDHYLKTWWGDLACSSWGHLAAGLIDLLSRKMIPMAEVQCILASCLQNIKQTVIL